MFESNSNFWILKISGEPINHAKYVALGYKIQLLEMTSIFYYPI